MSKTGTHVSPSELSLLLSSELQCAHRLADAADAISLSRYLAIDLVVETKPDTTPVTDADRAVERSIRAILKQDASRDLIIGEEFGGKELLETAEPGTRFWIIDPIDGTKNFLRGVPTWATLIAHGQITSDGKKVIDRGVVSAPALGRRWWAERGNGAYVTENFAPASPLSMAMAVGSQTPTSQTPTSQTPTSHTPNTPSEHSTTSADSSPITRRITVSKVGSLKDASLSFSDLIGWGARKDDFTALLEDVWRTRALGDFLSHMLVAEGSVDIAAEPSLALWDMAALAIIIEEAGGRFTSLDGVDGPFGNSALTTNGRLHEEVLRRLPGTRR